MKKTRYQILEHDAWFYRGVYFHYQEIFEVNLKKYFIITRFNSPITYTTKSIGTYIKNGLVGRQCFLLAHTTQNKSRVSRLFKARCIVHTDNFK